MEFKHKSVLLEETIEGLNIKPDGIYVDGTLGGAGHAREVCKTWVSSFKHYAGKKSNRRRIWNLNTNLYYWMKPLKV